MTQTITRRFVALIAAAVVTAFALVGMAGSLTGASAAATPVSANPDLSRNGSITVHKYQMPQWDSTNYPNDGEEIQTPPPGAVALDGVHFTAKKVDIDLTKSENWDKVAGLKFENDTVKSGTETFTVGTATDVKTANGGEATFASLAAGVYLIEEGADDGDNKITRKVSPFFVTIPMPNADKSYWMYDIDVYPKNSVTSVDKTVEDNDATKAGDPVKWTVTVDVPTLPEGETQSRLEIKDAFDKRLEYESVEVKIGDTVLAETTDYTVDKVTADEQDTVTVKLADAKLATLNGGETVTAVFTTKVKDETFILGGDDYNGLIPNTAEVFVNNPGEDTATTKTPTPTTPWGEIFLHKLDKDNGGFLTGAEFTVYASEADAKAGSNPIVTKTTNEDGDIVFTLKQGTYFVKETKAPAGYILSEDVHQVVIDSSTTETASIELEVENTKQNVPDLPITGASGRVLLMVGGSALLLLAVGTGFVSLRRRRS